MNGTSCCCATHNDCGFFNYMALFTSQKRQPLSQILKEEPCVRNVHCMCICLHLSELEPHETCSLSIIWPLRVGRCGESAHVLFICLKPTCSYQVYTFRTTCHGQLCESIDQPFVFDWQVFAPAALCHWLHSGHMFWIWDESALWF